MPYTNHVIRLAVRLHAIRPRAIRHVLVSSKVHAIFHVDVGAASETINRLIILHRACDCL